MAAPTLDDLQKELARGEHRPVYLFSGPETFLLEMALDAVKTFAFARTIRDFNFDRYDAREGDLMRALTTAATFPMMGPLRLVILLGMDELLAPAVPGRTVGQKREALRKEAEARLQAYLATPEPRTIFVMTADKVDQRRKLVKRVVEVGMHLDFQPVREREVPNWILGRSKVHGLAVAPPVATVLGEVLGSDLGAIERALEKLSLYLHGRGDVTIADIEAVVAYTKVHAIYELPDAVGQGDAAHALGLLRRMIRQGGGVRSDGFGVRMVSMLFRQFRQIWKVHSLLADGCPPARVAEFAGIPPFRANDFVRSARLFRRDDLMAALHHLFRADRAMKTSRGDAEHVLEALVLDLCGATAARRRSG